MFSPGFGYVLALMGAIGLCVAVAGIFVKIEKLIEYISIKNKKDKSGIY